MSYYENEWQKIAKTICDGCKLTVAATVLWFWALWLILKHALSRIVDPP